MDHVRNINVWQLILLVFFIVMFVVNWIEQRGDRRILVGLLVLFMGFCVLMVRW